MAKRRAVLLFGRVPPGASYDEQDVLVEAATVAAALSELGYAAVELPLDLDLRSAARKLRRIEPVFVFNLVESLEGQDRLAHLAPALLDFLGIPYTGSPTEAIFLTSNKLLTKMQLRASGLPTPDWVPVESAAAPEPAFPPPYIVKSVWEHASIGLTRSSVASDRRSLGEELARRRSASPRVPLYVEAFIEGREFNLAMLNKKAGEVQVLPPSEIQFLAYPEGRPRIVDYAAKWEISSPEYKNTPPLFDFTPRDSALLETLRRTALECWRLFGLSGYARVDFRVDSAGRPWVLEVNANPCLSPDAGFLAAAAKAGIGAAELVRSIVEGALKR